MSIFDSYRLRKEIGDMDSKIDFLYLSEPDMIKAGVKDMKSCVDVMEDLLITLYKGLYAFMPPFHGRTGRFSLRLSDARILPSKSWPMRVIISSPSSFMPCPIQLSTISVNAL